MKRIILLALLLLPLSVEAQVTSSTARRVRRVSSDPATCTKADIIFNTVSNLFKVCSATNTWSTVSTSTFTGGTVTTPILLPDGTAGAPSIGFSSDADGTGTGFFRSAANAIGVSTNGTERWTFNASGGFNCTTDGGCVVGNGAADPQSISVRSGGLTVRGSTSGSVLFGASATGGNGKVGNVTVTNPATGSTLTIADNGSLVTSGANSITLTSTGATNVTLPTTGTLATLAGSEALTNKTYNGLTVTSSTGTLTIANSKVFTVNNTLAINSTDGITMTTPTTSFTAARTDANNTFSGDLLASSDGARTIGASAANRFNIIAYSLSSTGATPAGEINWGGTTGKVRVLSGNLQLGSAVAFGFSGGDPGSVAVDVGLARAAAGTMKVTDGSTGYGKLQMAASVTWSSGSGSPEGVVTAAVGSLYTRTDGGAGTTLYVKESGAGNTGWIAK